MGTITALKERMVSLFDLMKTANVNTALKCVKDTTCLTLCETLKPEQIHETDLNEDIPAGIKVIRELPNYQEQWQLTSLASWMTCLQLTGICQQQQHICCLWGNSLTPEHIE